MPSNTIRDERDETDKRAAAASVGVAAMETHNIVGSVCISGLPLRPPKPVDGASILSKASRSYQLESQPPVEAMGGDVGRERIDDDRVYRASAKQRSVACVIIAVP